MSGQRTDWAATWSAAVQRPSAGFFPNWSEQGFTDQTLRQTVRLSIGGDTLRVRLSNRYGTEPLRIAGLTIAAAAAEAAVKPETLRALTAAGKTAFSVPAGADLVTDGTPFPTGAFDPVTFTMHLHEPSGPATFHAQSLTTTHLATGEHLADADGEAFTETTQSWYYLAAVEATGTPGDGIVVFGDSLTDGTGSTPDTDRRFPDVLAQRLAAAGRPRAVLNQGIGGNRATVDSAWLGDRATSRFGRDALRLPGVSTVVVLLGVNDIGISELAEGSPFPVLAPYDAVPEAAVIAAHRDLIAQARAAGKRVVGATLLPMQQSAFSTPRSEAKRAAANTWIRESGEYDAVLDLAAAMGDALDPAHDSGDGLHLNDAGYRAVAEAVDLTAL